MDIGPTELLIILFVVVLIFGPGRLVKLGSELGRGIRDFRQGLQGDNKIVNEVKTEIKDDASGEESDEVH